MTTKITTIASASLKRMDHDIQQAKDQRDQMDRLIKGLETARIDLSKAVLDGAVSTKSTPRRDASRTDELTAILADAGGPITVDDAMRELAQRGVKDDKRLVNSTLSYLQRKGVARRVDRGVWTKVA